MNTMKDFYTSISSPRPQGSYLEALSEITRINRKQVKTLMSADLWWQDWGAPEQTVTAQGA